MKINNNVILSMNFHDFLRILVDIIKTVKIIILRRENQQKLHTVS